MSKVKIIVTLISLLIILGLGAVAYSQVNKNKPKNESTSVSRSTPAPTIAKVSLKDLLTNNQNVTCQIKYPSQKGSGTIYVSGNNIRGDFNSQINGKQEETHLIQNNGTVYLWAGNQKTGTKLQINLSEMTTENTSSGVDVNQKYEADCSSWSVDSSKFTPPTDIKFSELPTNLTMPNQTTNNGKIDASICNKLSDPTQKAICLKSINEN